MSAIFADAVDQWRSIRSQWLDAVEQLYLEAENVTRGHMLNRRGREQGIESRSLFYGPAQRAYLYASDELVEFWREHGRLPYADFEARVLAERQCYCHQDGGAA